MQPLSPLHRAAQKGEVEELRRLVQKGTDLTSKDGEGRTALHHAVMRSHLPAVDVILELGGPKLLLAKDILGCSPVHLAAVQNQVTLILKLVAALLKDEGARTPLHEIARRQCMQDFMGFLHIGWELAIAEDLDEQTLTGLSPAWEAASKVMNLRRPGLAAVQKIMGWTPLHLAAAEGEVQLMESLIEDHRCDVLSRSVNSWTPLHYAAAHNKVEAIRFLVQAGCPASVQDSVASTPLHIAAGEGHIEAIRVLKSLGCEPDVKDRDDCTPLYCAAAWNQAEAVKCLDSMGCPSWVRSTDQRTAVHVAAEQGWTDLIDLLVRQLKNRVDVRDKWQFTPLHSAANGGHVSTIRKLIQFSHDVDVKDYLGRAPLHYAAMHGRLDAIEALVEAGASVSRKDAQGGFTPLHLAADAGQCEAVETLLRLGAQLEPRSAQGWTPLGLATLKGPSNVEAICRLVELGAKLAAVTEQSMLESPLHIAARCGRRDIVKRLLASKLPVLSRTKDGSTPLHYAAAFGQTGVIQTLLDAGCPVDATDDAQNTPLHLAAGCGFIETVEALVHLGADLNAQDVTACTPLQNAAHGTYSALAAMPSSQQPGHAAGSSGRAAGGALLPAPGSSGAARPAGPGKGGLTDSQAAAQLALCNGSSSHVNGLVPVRTGLAWATLGGALSELSSSIAADTGDLGGPDLRGLGIMQLLKQASRRRCSTSSSTSSAAAASTLPGASTPGGGLEMAIARLARGTRAQGDAYTDRMGAECTLEALLRRTEALQLSSIEADRARLISVAARLVQLGARVAAQDAEGRTALHLAAGCGDRAMVLKLVQLGTDVNCRDSVGGTPMHHAAMANKKEMMFTLARLGCDWRARADGIDGATAAFVLCGQHGKTTRQQKLMEAKLKRVFAEGMAAREAGQDPLQVPADSSASADTHCNGSQAADAASAARADANMAALLAEVDLEGEGAKAKRKRRKRKSKAKAEGETGSATGESEDTANEAGGDDVISSAPAMSSSRHASHRPLEQIDQGEQCAEHTAYALNGPKAEADSEQRQPSESRAEQGDATRSNNVPGSSRSAEKDEEEDPTADTCAQQEVREKLEVAIANATETVELGNEACDTQVKAALEQLDAAAAGAAEAGVSAKYAKKVLKRLQRQLDAILAPEVPAAAPLQLEPAIPCSPMQQAEQPQSIGMPEAPQGAAQAAERPAPSGSVLPRHGIDIQLPAQGESKGQQGHVPMQHPPVSLPASTSGPPGFGTAPQQQGRAAAPPVKAVSAAAEPAASQHKPPAPSVPTAWAAPLPRQAPIRSGSMQHPPSALPPSPRIGAPPPPQGFGSTAPMPDKCSQQLPQRACVPPSPPPPGSMQQPPINGANAYPAPPAWQQAALANQQSLFSQLPMELSRILPGPPLQHAAVPPEMQAAAARLAQLGVSTAAAPQSRNAGQGSGTPCSWQGSQGLAGMQQALFGRAAPDHCECDSRQSLDSQPRMGSLGAPGSREGSRRQSLENGVPGSLASRASTACGSEPGSLVNTPRTALANTSSSLFAHAPYPASPSHAAIASAIVPAASQPSAAYPAVSRLSGRSAGPFVGAFPDLPPPHSKPLPDLGAVPGMQQPSHPFGHGSLQLTPSHFGTNVSANTGQGGWLPWS